MEAKQAAQVAGRFGDLQGLRQVAAGIGLLLVFVWAMMFPFTLDDIRARGMGFALWGLVSLIAICAVVVVAIVRVSDWYKRRYGLVEQTGSQRRLMVLLSGTGLLAVLIPLEIDSVAMNQGHALPVNLGDFTLALWILGYWLYIGRQFRHYLLLAGLGFVLGVGSIVGIPPANFAWHIREMILYFAVATVVGGYLDHRIFAAALEPSEDRIGIEA